MKPAHGLLLLAAACILPALGGCARDEESQTAGPVASKGAPSPKELLEAMHKATRSGRLREAAAYLDESTAKQANEMLDLNDRLLGKVDGLAAAVESKVGTDKAERVRDLARAAGGGEPVPSPLAEAVTGGTIDWSKVKIDEQADRATVEVAGKKDRLTLVRIDGQWHFAGAVGDSPARRAEEAARAKRLVARLIEALDQFGGKVHGGTVTRDNFDAEFAKMNSALGLEHR